MKLDSLFRPATPDAADRLIAEHPLAQLVSTDGDYFSVSSLPLLLEGATSVEAFLLGHFDRHNPHAEALRHQPRALALFTGVHGYISPSLRRNRRIAPTWNYATVRCELDVRFDERDEFTRDVLERLVAHMEAGRSDAWSISDMGERYPGQARNIIAFRARVLNIDAKFKLGQNEQPDNFAGIVDGLRQAGQTPLAEAMMATKAKRAD
ncbi:MAG: FMN-binding negative transcriptional regulator [Sinobacteraceae bacterium]|nr:FMN-binding negative transcriptional regulator [Nevskiaceae bacterium]